MDLTSLKKTTRVDSATAHSVVGISNLLSTSAMALTRSVFFMPTTLWWDVWRLFGAPILVLGITNSVQSATQLISNNGGGSQTLYEDTTMPTTPSTDDLKQAITSIDSFSQQGFSEIGAIARLSLAALESPARSFRTPDDIANGLRAIWGISDDIQNCINCEAEEVGCNYENKKASRRYQAEQNLKAEVA